MTDRQKLMDQLLLHEGLKLKPYVDTTGHLTIGCGRNLTDNGISYAEAMMLLEHDVDAAITDLAGTYPWFARLDAVRQRALVDMRFNLGPSGLRGFKRMLRLLGEDQPQLAAASARDSLWFKQTKSRGVRVVHMLATGEEYV